MAAEDFVGVRARPAAGTPAAGAPARAAPPAARSGRRLRSRAAVAGAEAEEEAVPLAAAPAGGARAEAPAEEQPGSFIDEIPVQSFKVPASPLPLEGLGALLLLLGHGRGFGGPAAGMAVAAELLRSATLQAVPGGATGSTGPPSDALLASLFPTVLRRVLLDDELRSGRLDADELRGELLDGIALLRCQPAERQAVESRRLDNMLRTAPHPMLRVVLRGLPPHAAHEQVERLSALYLRGRERQPLRLRLGDIEAQLVKRKGMIEQHMEQHEIVGTHLGGHEELMGMLSAELQATGGSQGGAHDRDVSRGVGGDASDGVHGMRTLRREALTRAHDQAGFRGFWERWRGADFTASPSAIWADATSCGSAALTSFAATMDREGAVFDGTHPVYGQLRLIQANRRQAYADAQMLEPDGSVPVPEMRAWEWSEPAFHLFLACKFDEIDYVNGDGGILGLLNLREVNGYAPVPRTQIWSVPAVLDHAIPFIHRTFTHRGYAHVTTAGPRATSLPCTWRHKQPFARAAVRPSATWRSSSHHSLSHSRDF